MSKKVTTPAPSNPSSNSSSGSSVPKWIAAKLDAVVRRITDFVLWKSSKLTRADAEDIAAKAVGYALKPALFGTGTWPKSKDDLTRMARSKAMKLILDRNRYEQVRPTMLSLDKLMVGREGDEVAEKYGITPNYLYGIVHHAKEGLREVGPRYLAAA